MLKRDFFARSVHEVAPELIGATLLVDGVGERSWRFEAYDQEDPASHAYGGRDRPQRDDVRSRGPRVRLSLVRDPLVPEPRLRQRGRCESGRSFARSSRRAGIELQRQRRRWRTVRKLCSGPGKLCQALAITRRARRPCARSASVSAPKNGARCRRSPQGRGSGSRARRSFPGATGCWARRFSAVSYDQPDLHARPGRNARHRPLGQHSARAAVRETFDHRPRVLGREACAPRIAQRQADHLRNDTVQRLRQHQSHRNRGTRAVPLRGNWSSTRSMRCFGRARACRRSWPKAVAGRAARRPASTTFRRPVECRPRSACSPRCAAALARRNTRRARYRGSGRCRAATRRRATRLASPTRIRMCRAGMTAACVPASASLLNVRQISAGSVPPATACPWYSLSIGFSSIGIADPHCRRELRCVPDEPGVAVVLSRAGLPGDDSVGQSGAPAGARSGRRLRGCS